MSTFYKIFRTLLHILCGSALGYCLTSLTDFDTYPAGQQAVGVFCMCIIGCVVAFFWEFLQGVWFKAKLSAADIWVTTAFTCVGAIVALVFPNDVLFWVLLGASGSFIVYELITYYKKLHL